MKKYPGTLAAMATAVIVAAFSLVFAVCDGDNGTESTPTPAAGDYIFGNMAQRADEVNTAVTVTPRDGKSPGTLTVYYEGAGNTTYAKSEAVPQARGMYAVTFDVAAASGWNAATGLSAGMLFIRTFPAIKDGAEVTEGLVNHWPMAVYGDEPFNKDVSQYEDENEFAIRYRRPKDLMHIGADNTIGQQVSDIAKWKWFYLGRLVRIHYDEDFDHEVFENNFDNNVLGFGPGQNWGSIIGSESGDDVYINAPATRPSAFTVAMWIKPADITQDYYDEYTDCTRAQMLITLEAGSPWEGYQSCAFWFTDGSLRSGTGVTEGDGNPVVNITGQDFANFDPSLYTGKWAHFAFAFTGDSVKLYINGEYVSSVGAEAGNAAIGIPRLNMLCPGGVYANNGLFNGKIADIRLYDRALNAATVKGVYNEVGRHVHY